ncbi:MAG: pyrroline-5-carboxylate reductase family protein, partial [Candidatus Merdivicinus sp.]
MLKLGVIGCGNMATAILRGVAAGYKGAFSFCGFDVSAEKTAALESIGLKGKKTIAGVMQEAEYVLLSVKPQNMSDVLAQIAACPERDRIFLSIAAGVPAERIKRELGYDAKV